MPLDILHVITGLGVGGAENILVNTATLQVKQGFKVSVVSLLPGGENRTLLEQNGVAVHDLGMTRGIVSFGAIFRFAKFIRGTQPRVVQSWLYHADLLSLFGLLLSRRRSETRLFWGVRSSNMDGRLYSFLFRIVMKLCVVFSSFPDGVIANSEAGRIFHQKLGYKARSFYVVDNGIDTDRFVPDRTIRRRMREQFGICRDIPVFSLVGRNDPMKDQKGFLKSFAGLQTKAFAVITGQGTELLPPQENVLLLGKRSDVENILKMSDFIVSSSAFGEGFSNAIAEGMACGLPAVATDVGDSERVIGTTGMLVPPSDVRRLTEAMETLLSLPLQKYNECSEQSRQRIILNFSLHKMVDGFLGIYGFSEKKGNICAE